jgi:hypothetical protein
MQTAAKIAVAACCLVVALPALAVHKCTDAKTGAVRYSDAPCQGAEKGARVAAQATAGGPASGYRPTGQPALPMKTAADFNRELRDEELMRTPPPKRQSLESPVNRAAAASPVRPSPARSGPMGGVYAQVASDAIDRYKIAERQGTYMDQCVQAGFVAAAMLQAKMETEYAQWLQVRDLRCSLAGIRP